MGRLWQTLLLAKWNPIFAWVPTETILHENRPHYYRAIEDARKANDSGAFIEFTLAAILEIVARQKKHQEEHQDKHQVAHPHPRLPPANQPVPSSSGRKRRQCPPSRFARPPDCNRDFPAYSQAASASSSAPFLPEYRRRLSELNSYFKSSESFSKETIL